MLAPNVQRVLKAYKAKTLTLSHFSSGHQPDNVIPAGVVCKFGWFLELTGSALQY
jgi:hypothetical protein